MPEEKIKFKNPRLRIAPSPTGYAHIGTARTVLFNWLLAKKYGGKFVLRIEDTDQSRYKPEFERDLIEQLKWLELDWDEGPDIGGDFGPYKQSQRKEIYIKYLDKLLKQNKAYYCFCSPEELEKKRKECLKNNIAYKYDNKCRNISLEEAEKRISKGELAVIRLKLDNKAGDNKLKFNDLIRGSVEFDISLTGDFIISKNNKEPVFIFSNVVDDCEMKISHIIRGEEHLPNMAKQLAIYKALELDLPQFAHIPLILNEDKSKMSKRFGDVAIKDYREKGYLPEALVNFILFLGWHPKEKTGETPKEILTRQEMIDQFEIERVQKGGAVFDTEKLDWINGEYIKKLSPNNLIDEAMPFLGSSKAFFSRCHLFSLPPEQGGIDLRKIVSLIQNRIKKLSDLPEIISYFLELPEYDKNLLVWKNMSEKDLKDNLELAYNKLSDIDKDKFNLKKLEEALMPEAEKRGKGEFLWPLRVSLSGRKNSASPFEILDILGKEESLRRIKTAIEKVGD